MPFVGTCCGTSVRDDGDFQQQRFVDLVNNDLANTIGNLLNRTPWPEMVR